MKYRHYLTSLLLSLPIICFSQSEMKDSISFGQIKPNMINMGSMLNNSVSRMNPSMVYQFEYNRYFKILPPLRFGQPLDLHIPIYNFTPGEASLFQWNSGAFVATGSTRSFPGLMQIDSGALGFSQSVENFTFYVGGMVNKYGYFNGLHTQYGLNGNIAYQFTPKLSATLFGEYYFGQPPRMANGMLMPPAMIGFYGRSTFGGYFDYRINERWGVQTGIQTVQQVGTNRYETEPIVTPYYKISKKVAIGLPVGQILYHILKK